ncbi:hypothetical protein QAD02_018348 [Eretmocerus hayati]|uniref:Uncharacterized protein n=1 Tax=Eretmocerus hayati TaxID=131215 RepID=A0ACC2PIC0_9HYME|nr:hypothetical protein QAD02_018348 [Eretmocerus hayati]
MVCDVIVQLPVGDDQSGQNGICKIEVMPVKDDGIKFNHSSLALDYLGKSRKPLISWAGVDAKNEFFYKYIGIIDMDTCEVLAEEFRIPHSAIPIERLIKIVSYEDTFDVFVFESNECSNSKWCRISFDEKSQKIGKAQAFPLNLMSLNLTLPVPSSKSKDIVVHGVLNTESGSKIVAYRVMFDEVIELKTTITSVDSTLIPLVSIANNIILICAKHLRHHRDFTHIHCNKYINGSTEPTFDFEDIVPFDVMNVHNFPDQKIFLFGVSGQSYEGHFNYSIIQKNGNFIEREDFNDHSYLTYAQSEEFTFDIQNEYASFTSKTYRLCIYFATLKIEKENNLLVDETICLKNQVQ